MIKTDDEKEIEVKKGKNVMVIRDSDDDEDIEVISGDDDASYFFIDNDGKGEPLYYIDGKKSKSKDLKKISPNNIESVNVFKGDKAIEKYGKKLKMGLSKSPQRRMNNCKIIIFEWSMEPPRKERFFFSAATKPSKLTLF